MQDPILKNLSPSSPLSITTPYKWLFMDLNSYFASVEQQENPRLRGKPIAVVPTPTDSTCAIAASYEAKKFGIRTGTRIYDAKKLCPDLICIPAHHDLYVAYHHKILAEVVRHTPINKVWSIDELSSRLPPNKQNREAAIGVARRIKSGLAENVGEFIRCSIGIAPNGYLAKVATDMMKPDGLVILDEENYPARLFDLKLTDLTCINTGMEARLHKAGIRSTHQLYHLSPKQARAVWGSVEGERFWYRLHGFDIPDQQTKHSMIGHSRILDPELRGPESARLVCRRLTIKAASRLRRMNMHATHFDLSVRSGGHDGERFSAGVTISPSQDNFTFLQAMEQLWAAMMTQMKPWKIKKISVTFHGLCETGDITPDLFDQSSDSFRKLQNRNDAISAMMDKINERYGAESIRLGVSPRTQAGYVGTKIAFNRIPDMAEFHE